MTITKLEKVYMGEKTLVKITYKNFWGKTKSELAYRDIYSRIILCRNDKIIYSDFVKTFYHSDANEITL